MEQHSQPQQQGNQQDQPQQPQQPQYQQGQQLPQPPQEPKGYAGLKAAFWIAMVMLLHFVALLVAQIIVMVFFMMQDIASGVLTYAMDGGLLYNGEPVVTSATMSSMSDAYLNRYVYETSSYGTVLALPLVMLGLWICNKVQKTKMTESIPCKKFPVVPNLLGFIVGFSVCVPVSYIVTYTFLNDLSPETNVTMELMFANSPLWLLILATAIAAPVMEELTFRGFIYTKLQTTLEPWLKERSYIITILLQGLLFGVFHMNLQQFIYASALGMLFGWMRYYTKSVWPGIFAHIGFNFFSVALYGLLQYQEEWSFAKRVAETSDFTMLLIALPVFVISLFLFEIVVKKSRKTSVKTSQNQ